jgi:hypothetical protein
VVRFGWIYVYWLGAGGEEGRCIVDGHVGPGGGGALDYIACAALEKAGLRGLTGIFCYAASRGRLPIRVYNAMETKIAPERAESLSPLEI